VVSAGDVGAFSSFGEDLVQLSRIVMIRSWSHHIQRHAEDHHLRLE
jgi:hypothetical protein